MRRSPARRAPPLRVTGDRRRYQGNGRCPAGCAPVCRRRSAAGSRSGLGRWLRQRRRRRWWRCRWVARRLGLGRTAARRPRPFLLEPHAEAGELPLDLVNRALALVEPLAFGLGERELLRRLPLALLGLAERLGELRRARPPALPGARAPTLSACELQPQLLELAFPGGDVLRPLAQLCFIRSTSASACS